MGSFSFLCLDGRETECPNCNLLVNAIRCCKQGVLCHDLVDKVDYTISILTVGFFLIDPESDYDRELHQIGKLGSLNDIPVNIMSI